VAALRQWSGIERTDGEREAMEARIHAILERADRNGRVEEVRTLLKSFLS
jgi:hypothetical protein